MRAVSRAPLNMALDVPHMSQIVHGKLMMLWCVTALLSAVHVLLGSDTAAHIRALDLILFTMTVALLPFAAGFFSARAGKRTALATTAAGASIALATILGVGVGYAFTASGWQPFAGFIIATAMFALVPSAAFGLIGGWVARKYEPKNI